MNASELVAKLQALIAEHGDATVYSSYDQGYASREVDAVTLGGRGHVGGSYVLWQDDALDDLKPSHHSA